jgi:hypothetical protein
VHVEDTHLDTFLPPLEILSIEDLDLQNARIGSALLIGDAACVGCVVTTVVPLFGGEISEEPVLAINEILEIVVSLVLN